MTGNRSPAPEHSSAGTPHSWRAAGQSRLDALLDRVPNSEFAGQGVPWQPGYSMQIQSRGGAQSLERERIAIVGHAGYVSCVTGHRETTTDSQTLTCEKTHAIDVGRMDSPEPDDGSGVSWGRDRLHVRGNASLEYGSREVGVTGTLERIWNEHSSCTVTSWYTTRVLGMFTRATAGPSMEVSAVNTFDVHGGAALTAACRTHLAALGYQVVTCCARAYGLYCRKASFTITPYYLAQQEKNRGRSSIGSKLSRLGSLAWHGYAHFSRLAPVIPLVGLIPLTGIVLFRVFWLIRFIRREKDYVPPPRAVRVHRVYCPSIHSGHTQMTYL